MKTLASLAVLFCLAVTLTGTAHAGGGSASYVDTVAEADYIVEAQASLENQSFWKTIFVMPVAAAHATIRLKSREGRLVFAYAVDRSLAIREQKSTAESCAKHLKEIVY